MDNINENLPTPHLLDEELTDFGARATALLIQRQRAMVLALMGRGVRWGQAHLHDPPCRRSGVGGTLKGEGREVVDGAPQVQCNVPQV